MLIMCVKLRFDTHYKIETNSTPFLQQTLRYKEKKRKVFKPSLSASDRTAHTRLDFPPLAADSAYIAVCRYSKPSQIPLHSPNPEPCSPTPRNVLHSWFPDDRSPQSGHIYSPAPSLLLHHTSLGLAEVLRHIESLPMKRASFAHMQRIPHVLVDFHRSIDVEGESHQVEDQNERGMDHLQVANQFHDASALLAGVICVEVQNFAAEIVLQTRFQAHGSVALSLLLHDGGIDEQGGRYNAHRQCGKRGDESRARLAAGWRPGWTAR